MTSSKKKSQHERVAECVNIRGQLAEHGLDAIGTISSTVIPKMNSFVRDGVHDSGRVFVPELGRHMEFCFTNNPGIVSYVVLRAPPITKPRWKFHSRLNVDEVLA